MLSEVVMIALRDDLARSLFVLEGAPPPQDEGDVPEERAVRSSRLRMAFDLLNHILRGSEEG